jgi:hypothetical protein
MDLGEVEWRDIDCIGLSKERNYCIILLNAVMNFRVQKCWEIPEWMHNLWPFEWFSAS